MEDLYYACRCDNHAGIANLLEHTDLDKDYLERITKEELIQVLRAFDSFPRNSLESGDFESITRVRDGNTSLKFDLLPVDLRSRVKVCLEV